MLKRAVFGILGHRGVPQRSHGCNNVAPPSTAEGGRRAKREKKLKGSRGREQGSEDDYGVSSDEEREETQDKETGTHGGASSSDEEDTDNPLNDPTVRMALIKRAAAVYAQDPKTFLRAMKKHEGKTDAATAATAATAAGAAAAESDEEVELLDEASDDTASDAESAEAAASSKAGKKRKRKGAAAAAAGERAEEEDKDIDFAYEDDRDFEVEREPEFTRGKFHCRLCPQKIFIFEADLEKHLQSKVHKKREKKWNAEQNLKKKDEVQSPPGAAAAEERVPRSEEAEGVGETENTKDGEANKSGKRKNRFQKWNKLRKERRKAVEDLTPDEIRRRKEKFQRKKQRRMMRKAAEAREGEKIDCSAGQ